MQSFVTTDEHLVYLDKALSLHVRGNRVLVLYPNNFRVSYEVSKDTAKTVESFIKKSAKAKKKLTQLEKE